VKRPARGEVWLVDLGLAAKVRPCLVISVPFESTERSIVTIVPHTTSVRGSRFEVSIATNFLKAGAFDVQNLTTVPAAWFIRRLGALGPDELVPIEDGVLSWLGID
jgi:mRNA interferase MazF